MVGVVVDAVSVDGADLGVAAAADVVDAANDVVVDDDGDGDVVDDDGDADAWAANCVRTTAFVAYASF